MKDLHTLWQKPIYLPYLQPPLTPISLEKAEATLGYKLPKELIRLLEIQNGGYIRKTLEDSLHEQIYGIGPYFPSLTDVDWTDYKEWVSFELEGLIPFDGDGHWYLCLDYRKSKTSPKVTYIDTESDYDDVIADSFKDYLELLVFNVEDEYVIYTQKPLEVITRTLEESLNIQFEAPDDQAHGYLQYRARWNDQWLWIHDNTIPNGFIREKEARYEELLPLAQQEVQMYPELPAGSLILTCYDERIQQQLQAKGWDIKALETIL